MSVQARFVEAGFPSRPLASLRVCARLPDTHQIRADAKASVLACRSKISADALASVVACRSRSAGGHWNAWLALTTSAAETAVCSRSGKHFAALGHANSFKRPLVTNGEPKTPQTDRADRSRLRRNPVAGWPPTIQTRIDGVHAQRDPTEERLPSHPSPHKPPCMSGNRGVGLSR